MLQRAAKKSLAENGVYKHYLKLVEAEGTDAVNTIVSVSELIRSEADDGDGSYKVSMDNFLSMLQNAGLNIDYAGLKSYHEADPRLQMEIQDFNEKEVVLAGGGSSEEDTLNMQPQGEVPPEKKVNDMAKSALAKRESIEEMDNLDSQTKYSEGDLVTINGISYVLEKSEDGDLWAISNNAEHEIEFEPGMEDYHQAVGEGYSEIMKTNEAGEEEFKPHTMYDKEGKSHYAKTEKQHLDMNDKGWTHDKPAVSEGYYEMPPMDPKYVERKGLEGPFGTRSGKVVYYDPKEGSYYDPDSDIYLTYNEFQAYDDSRPEDYTMDIKMPKNESLPPENVHEDKESCEDCIRATLKKEGGAAGLDAIEKACKDAGHEEDVVKVMAGMEDVKKHEEGDYILENIEETFDYWQGVESIAKLAGLRKPK
jgi:hypothetical protein